MPSKLTFCEVYDHLPNKLVRRLAETKMQKLPPNAYAFRIIGILAFCNAMMLLISRETIYIHTKVCHDQGRKVIIVSSGSNVGLTLHPRQ
jgi:hypothetical protein